MSDLNSFSKAKDTALRYISYRSRTEKELRIKLKEKGYDSNVISEVNRRLKEMGYIDDRNVAKEAVYSLYKYKGYGKNLILRNLIERGIERKLAEEVIEELGGEFDELELAKKVLKKKFKHTHLKFSSKKDLNRVAQYLYRRGYSWDVIHRITGMSNEGELFQ